MVENGSSARAVFEKEGVQFGVFVEDGVVVAARLAQLMLEADEKNVAILTDIRNAFNTVPRAFMLKELFEHPTLMGLWRIMHWAYGQPSLLLLFNRAGEVVAWIGSYEGVKQGCVFGSFGFAIATLRLFVRIKKEHPSVSVVAIIDDLTLTGPQEQTLAAFEKFLSICPQGMEVQKRKCKLLASEAALLPSLREAAFEHELEVVMDFVPLCANCRMRTTPPLLIKLAWMRRPS